MLEKGWPILQVQRVRRPGAPFALAVRQAQVDRGWTLFETPVDLDIRLTNRGWVRRRVQLRASEWDTLTVADCPDDSVPSFRFDPEGWLLKEVAPVSSVGPVPAHPAAPIIEAVYPQPAVSGAELTVDLRVMRTATLTATLYDMLGRAVCTAHGGCRPSGETTLRLPLQGCRPGAYLLCVAADGARVTTRVLISPRKE